MKSHTGFGIAALRCPWWMRTRWLAMMIGVGTGCGNFSQEDLLFLAARPTRDDLTLQPPGAAAEGGRTQALGLACIEGDLRCEAERAAQLLNELTFALLGLLEDISDQPPTVRAVGYRRWGPFTVGDVATATYMLQMERLPTANDAPTSYRFCLHGHAGGDDRSGQTDVTVPSCDDDGGGDESLLMLWDGNISAEAGTSLRTASGGMRLLGDRVSAVSGDRSLGGTLLFSFEHAAGNRRIDIDVDQAAFDDGDERGPLRYRFATQPDNSGSVVLEIARDLIGAGIAFDRSAPEQLRLRSVWQADQSGRGEGSVSGGDLDAPVIWQQCWSASPTLTTTYLQTHDGVQSGDDTACVLAEADLPS
jgi:hypothetical protein